MRKRFLKGAVCAALAVSMALGTVMVGASDKMELKEHIASIDTANSGINCRITSVGVEQGKIPLAKSAKSGRVTARSVQYDTAYLVYNAYTIDKVNMDLQDTTHYTNWILGRTTADANTMVVNITLQKSGYLYVPFIGQDENGLDQNTELTLYQGNTKVGWTYGSSGVLKSQKVLGRGTYQLVLKAPYGKIGYAAVYPYYVTSENIGMSTSSKLIVGNGNNIVQTFKISGRRQVWIDSDKAGYGYIQRYTSGKWKTVSYQNYFYNSNGKLERAYYALSTGTYRFVMKPANGNFVEFRYGSKLYSGSYATKKSKAKTLGRKKSAKYNVLTATDAKGKSHYYKIKVTKRRSTRINITTAQNSGNIRVTVYGKGLKTKNLYFNGSKSGYVKGTLRKGTYYIRVTKMTQNTSGRYSVQYKY